MYIITRKGAMPSIHHSIVEATQEAVKISDPPCWIWQVKVSRLGTMKQIEVPWEDIKDTRVEGIECIQNRRKQEDLPVDGQLYFNQEDGQIWEYRRGQPDSKIFDHLGRFIREVREEVVATSPTAVGQYLQDHVYTPFGAFDQEEMHVLLLDSRLRITHEMMIYRGTVNHIPIRLAEIFKEAVRFNLPSLIVAHNHPSGDPTPSTEDIAMTRRLNEGAKLLDLQFLDHLIVGQNSWVSLKQLNGGFDRWSIA